MAANNDPASSALAQALAAQAQAFMLGQSALAGNLPAQNPLLGIQPNNMATSQMHPMSSMPQFQQPPNLGFQMAMSHIMTDALKMIVPVGSSPNDEELLVQALVNSEGKGQTYRSALDALHGVNSHAANLWKDYFLEHHHRIEAMVQNRRRPSNGAKKPSFPEHKSSHSHNFNDSREQTLQGSGSPPTRGSAGGSVSNRTSSATVRPTHSPHAHTSSRKRVAPRAPSRSPTPPGEPVIRTDGRYQYTPEEKDYFFRYIRYRLQQNSSLRKQQICDELYARLPHHTAASWQSFWHNKRDDVDPIFESFASSSSRAPRSGYHGMIEISDSSDNELESDYQEESEGDDTDSDEDVQGMSGPGESLTEGDKRVMARYIASFSDWDTMSNRVKWGAFEQMYPQRNHKAWAEIYRTKQSEMKPLIKKYQRRNESRQSIRKQVGRPTWANKEKKRVYSDMDETGSREPKRPKDGTGR